MGVRTWTLIFAAKIKWQAKQIKNQKYLLHQCIFHRQIYCGGASKSQFKIYQAFDGPPHLKNS